MTAFIDCFLLLYWSVFTFNVEHAVKVHVPVDEQHRITGGSIASPTDVPWLAVIVTDNAYFCGGSLISSLWILTAARCA
jgi:secreted trypsin-like serine protease